jgi:hypothetical protein
MHAPATGVFLVRDTHAGVEGRDRKKFKVFKPCKQKGPDYYDIDTVIAYHTKIVDEWPKGVLRNTAMLHMVRLKDVRVQMVSDVHETSMQTLIGPNQMGGKA